MLVPAPGAASDLTYRYLNVPGGEIMQDLSLSVVSGDATPQGPKYCVPALLLPPVPPKLNSSSVVGVNLMENLPDEDVGVPEGTAIIETYSPMMVVELWVTSMQVLAVSAIVQVSVEFARLDRKVNVYDFPAPGGEFRAT